jgi:NADH:ubiquinone oxidoreductase subunit 3 (subunit A)
MHYSRYYAWLSTAILAILSFAYSPYLAIVFAGLSYVVSAKQADVEKVSAYECGFDPFDDTRKTFDVRFYLVAILFLIFDLEVSFLFPWVVSLGTLPLLGFWSMILFLVILTT